MTAKPPEGPDRIEPYSPPEKRPPQPEPVTPTPPEIYPVEPDTDEPGRHPDELPQPDALVGEGPQSRRCRQATPLR